MNTKSAKRVSRAEYNTLEPGTIIDGRFLIGKCLANGSTAGVYRCFERGQEGRPLVAKLLHPNSVQDNDAVQRFLQEIQASQKVRDPHVIRPLEVIIDRETVGYVMEYLSGGDLSDRLRLGRFQSVDDVVNIVGQIAAGLAAIHAAGIVHRDLKPENVLFNNVGEAKISDFGIAKLPSGESLTREGNVLGSVHFVSPEYLLYNRFDQRSDIYGLGMIAYEMITGQIPFAECSPIEALTNRVSKDPVSPSQLRKGCPERLSAVVMKALARDPNKRYQSAAEFLDALRMLEEHGSVSRQGKGRPRNPSPTVATSSLAFRQQAGLIEGPQPSAQIQPTIAVHQLAQRAPLRKEFSILFGIAALLSIAASILTLLIMAEIVFIRHGSEESVSSPGAKGIKTEQNRSSSSVSLTFGQKTGWPVEAALNQVETADSSAEIVEPYDVLPPLRAGALPSLELSKADVSEGQYVVKKGDTLWALSQEYNVTVESLSVTNEVPDPLQLPIGKVLKIDGKK